MAVQSAAPKSASWPMRRVTTTCRCMTSIGASCSLRAERPTLGSVHSQVMQNVAVRLDLAMKAFFRRVKAGETPGFPRFRGAGRYDSFCYPQSRVTRSRRSRCALSKIGDCAAGVASSPGRRREDLLCAAHSHRQVVRHVLL